MPFYKLICRSCGEAFEKRASIEERTNRRISCPRCGSVLLENDYSAGSAAIKFEERLCPRRASCGCSCEGCAGSEGGGE